jgi:phage terminase large subunit-like protein
VNDRAQWRKANPAIEAGFLAEDAIASAAAASPEASFRTFRLGQWVQSGACWLPEGVWASSADPFEPVDAAPSWVGVDVSLRRDSAAVVMVQRRSDGRWHVTSRCWDPLTGGAFDVADVMDHLRELADLFDVKAIAYDPRLFDLPARQLLDEGLPMIEAPLSVERFSPACGYAYEQIVAGKVSHDGDDVLAAHVLAAQSRSNERGWSLSKSRSRRPIDAAVAMVLALHEAAWVPPAPPEPLVFAF